MTQNESDDEPRSFGPDGEGDSSETNGDDNSAYLRTDHLLPKLGQHAVSGGIITAAAQSVNFVINFVSAIVLARLLSPEEFGLMGMVLAVTGILGLFTEVGLSTATIQRETITHAQVSNLFWINIALGALIGLVSMALSPAIAWFYGDPRLVGIMIVLSTVFFLSGATVQHRALLNRQMRFGAIAIVQVVSLLIGFVVGCVMALKGFSYWSLVGMQLCVAAVTLLITWSMCGWRPSLPRRHTGTISLVAFGAQLTVSDLIARVAGRMDSILVGRFFGAEPLGLFTRAQVLLYRPLEQLLAPVGSVLIPVLSRVQTNEERYRRIFLRAYRLLGLATLPLMAALLALSEPLVLLLLGSKWGGAVPLFKGFTLAAISIPLSFAASWLFLSQGRGQDLLRAYTILSSLMVLAFLCGLPWGPLGVVMAFAIYGLAVRLPILYYLAGRNGPVGAADLWKGFLAYLPTWGAVYGGATFGRILEEESPFAVQLLVGGTMGLISGIVVILIQPGPRESLLHAVGTARKMIARSTGGSQ